jgi:large subunit ribosomal protein L21
VAVYAIIRTGGKQYRVEQGDVVRFEHLPGDVGATVTLDDVLLVAGGDGEAHLGGPRVEGASVVGTVVEQGRGGKIRVFKYKKRKHYRRTRGHRQSFTAVRIDAVRVS